MISTTDIFDFDSITTSIVRRVLKVQAKGNVRQRKVAMTHAVTNDDGDGDPDMGSRIMRRATEPEHGRNRTKHGHVHSIVSDQGDDPQHHCTP